MAIEIPLNELDLTSNTPTRPTLCGATKNRNRCDLPQGHERPEKHRMVVPDLDVGDLIQRFRVVWWEGDDG